MEKNCSTCKHNPVDEHCKGCRENAIKWFEMLKESFVNTEYEVYLTAAIEALQQKHCEIHLTCTDEDRDQIDLTRIVLETLAECGIYGEEATIKFIGTLKRLGRSDLIPPCAG